MATVSVCPHAESAAEGSGHAEGGHSAFHECRNEPDALERIYESQTPDDLIRPAWVDALLVLVLGLILAIARDRARRCSQEEGRRLKGPQMVTLREFNEWSGTDGISFLTTESSELLSIPRSLESSHLMIMGDRGAGKSVLQRRVLNQVQALLLDQMAERLLHFSVQGVGQFMGVIAVADWLTKVSRVVSRVRRRENQTPSCDHSPRSSKCPTLSRLVVTRADPDAAPRRSAPIDCASLRRSSKRVAVAWL
jgi:hypothetical protein